MNELIEVNIETLNQLPTRDKYTALKKWQKWNRNQTILLKKEMILIFLPLSLTVISR